jgi:electron-transferring-flavoprotein dehydrogenase
MHATSGHLKTDVVIVGAGPAGLACAIHWPALRREPRQILVLEKSAHPGGHLLSGAVLRPNALRQLLTPEEFAALPLGPVVTRDSFHALTPAAPGGCRSCPRKCACKACRWSPPPPSAGRWPRIATGLGVEILTGQTADALVWEADRVAGVRCELETILAPVTVLAEGPAGLLTRELLARRPELAGANRQTHGIGLKEIIEIPARPETAGTVAHTFGFPLGRTSTAAASSTSSMPRTWPWASPWRWTTPIPPCTPMNCSANGNAIRSCRRAFKADRPWSTARGWSPKAAGIP